jgi:catechol 2,3-dioxygenase-like lactoylglutathione lyase family enzyme
VTVEDPMMVGAATVFVVTDIAKSTEHYRDVLGFTVTFECGNPTFSGLADKPILESGRQCSLSS